MTSQQDPTSSSELWRARWRKAVAHPWRVPAYAARWTWHQCLRAGGFSRRLWSRGRGVLKRSALLRPRLGWLIQYDPRPLGFGPEYAHPAPPPPVPNISLITPSFNQGAFIDRTIRSVIDQGYPSLEYIVQDGGSDDQTPDILRRHAAALHSWESIPDTGQASAINRGFARSTGEIMGWLNSDDLLLPGALNAVGTFFRLHPYVDVVYGHRVLIDEKDCEIGRWVLPPHDDLVLRWADYIPQETLFWRRRMWERVGGAVDESFQFAVDWDLLLRFRKAGARFARIPRFLGAFRIHCRQKTSASMSDVGQREMDLLRQRELGRLPSQFEIDAHVWRYLARHLALHHLHTLGVIRY